MLNKANALFKTPTPLRAMDRIASEARLIIDEQTRKRAELTASLKAARLGKEALEATLGIAPAKKKRKK